MQLLDPLLDKLAELYTVRGKHEAAEPRLKQLLEIRRAVLPMDGKEIMPVYARYIDCLDYQGKVKESTAVCRALAAHTTAWAQNRTLIKRAGEAARTLFEHQHYKSVIALSEPIFFQVNKHLTEPNSRPVSVLLCYLARALKSEGNAAEAQQILLDDIALRTKTFPQDTEALQRERQLLSEIQH